MWVTGGDRARLLVLGYGFGVGTAGWGFVPVSRRLRWGLSGVGLSVDEPPVPSSLPILGHRWSASTSFVLAALRALHVGSCAAVTDAATIEEGTTTPLALQVGDTHGWSSLGSEAIETNRNREDQSPVRATTAFKRLIDLRGVSVTEVGFGPDQVVVTVRLRSRRLACPLCGFTTRARYDLRPVASSWGPPDLGRWRLQIRADLARLACPTHGVLTQGRAIRPGRFTFHPRLRRSGGVAGHHHGQDRAQAPGPYRLGHHRAHHRTRHGRRAGPPPAGQPVRHRRRRSVLA